MISLEFFTKAALMLEQLLEKEQAIFSIRRKGISLKVLNEVPQEIDGVKLNSIFNEIIRITAGILTQSPKFINECNRDQRFAEKADIIRKHVITENMLQQYRFIASSVSNILQEVQVQPIIKPDKDGLNNLVTAVFRLQVETVSGDNDILELDLSLEQVKNLAGKLNESVRTLNLLDEKIAEIDFSWKGE